MEPPSLSRCPKFIKRWLEPVLKYAISRTPLNGVGVGGWQIWFNDGIGDQGRSATIVPPPLVQAITANYLHPLSVVDASNATNAMFTVTPGNYLDTTNSAGVTWIPQINNVNITNVPPPVIQVTNTATCCFALVEVNPLDGSGAQPPGQVLGVYLQAGTSIPNSTNVNQYQLITNIAVQSGPIQVVSQNSGVSGSQVLQACAGALLYGLQ